MKTALHISLLIVGVLIAVLLVLNLAQGGFWIIEGLNGVDGKDGKNGLDGKDGIDGVDGQNGTNGQNGQNGQNGKSAYELACEDGFRGSLHEWLLSLAVRGQDGVNGTSGSDGVGVRDVKIDASGNLIVYLTDGTRLTAGYVGGDGYVSDTPDADGFYEVYETAVLTNVEASLNLRLTPDTENGEIFTSIVKGTELLRIGDQRTENGFSRFLYNDTVCYARSKFFETKYIYEGEIPTVSLPERLTLTRGETRWFFTDQFLPDRTEDLKVSYSYSGKGTRITDGNQAFAITPSQAGSATLNIKVQKRVDGELRTILERSVAITVVEPKSTLALTGLFIGDSRVSDGAMVKDMVAKMPNLTLLGTRQAGSSGVYHEGRAAWSTEHYLYSATSNVSGSTVTNPFYNPSVGKFDFAYYIAQNPAAAELDFVVINLGANDSFSSESAANINEMVRSIKASLPNVRVLILSEYLSPQGGYYLSRDTNLNVHAMRARQFAYFAMLSEQLSGREDEEIYLVSSHLSINAWSDWTRETVATANGSESRITDVIHLGSEGYLKEAAALRAYLYGLFS